MDRLLEDLEVLSARGAPEEVEVTSVEHDSREVRPGALFCCIPGSVRDGHLFAGDALRRGAVGFLAERALEVDAPQAIVAPGSARASMAKVAASFYGHPSRSLRTVGVTGTNGKTTVTHLLASIFDAHGLPATVIGTLGGARTTPEATVLQRLLAEARDGGKLAATIEVSSHALTQGRVEGMCFDAGVFTNLGHDHLDHHGTIERYFEAKASLFEPSRSRLGVVNEDDPWGRRLLAQSAIEMFPYSASEAADVKLSFDRTSFRWRGHDVHIRLAGAFQVSNALAAATAASALGVPDDVVAKGLAAARPVPGRFEVLETPAHFSVVVDYAHTPEALTVVLDSARRMAGAGRILLVFGAGGERDQEKRPAMGHAASRGADVVVVTTDNPRGEDPRSIMKEVVAGASGVVLIEEPDRARAIGTAMKLAAPGDVVLIAGKGHETEMEVAGERVSFDDRVVALDVARRHGKRDREEFANDESAGGS